MWPPIINYPRTLVCCRRTRPISRYWPSAFFVKQISTKGFWIQHMLTAIRSPNSSRHGHRVRSCADILFRRDDKRTARPASQPDVLFLHTYQASRTYDGSTLWYLNRDADQYDRRLQRCTHPTTPLWINKHQNRPRTLIITLSQL